MIKTFLMSLLSAAFVCGEFQHLLAADKIRIAVANFNVSFMSAGVAAKKGYFRGECLGPEIIGMRPPESITAQASGDIDYTTVVGSVVPAAERGSTSPFSVCLRRIFLKAWNWQTPLPIIKIL